MASSWLTYDQHPLLCSPRGRVQVSSIGHHGSAQRSRKATIVLFAMQSFPAKIVQSFFMWCFKLKDTEEEILLHLIVWPFRM